MRKESDGEGAPSRVAMAAGSQTFVTRMDVGGWQRLLELGLHSHLVCLTRSSEVAIGACKPAAAVSAGLLLKR